MPIKTLSDIAGSLYINGVEIKKLYVNGVELYSKPGVGPGDQEWDDDVPTKSGYRNLNQVPVDAISAKGGLVGVSISTRKFTAINPVTNPNLAEGIRSTGGLVGASISQSKFEFKSVSDGIQAAGGLCSVTLIDVNL